jgi:hypothetical protein
MYGDDGLFAGNEFVVIMDPDKFGSLGIRMHPDKSGWVKRDGKWLKPLKFLGMIYDGEKDEWRADTRGRAANPAKKRKATESSKLATGFMRRYLALSGYGEAIERVLPTPAGFPDWRSAPEHIQHLAFGFSHGLLGSRGRPSTVLSNQHPVREDKQRFHSSSVLTSHPSDGCGFDPREIELESGELLRWFTSADGEVCKAITWRPLTQLAIDIAEDWKSICESSNFGFVMSRAYTGRRNVGEDGEIIQNFK